MNVNYPHQYFTFHIGQMLLNCKLVDSFSNQKVTCYNMNEVLFILNEAILFCTFHFKYSPRTLMFLFLLEDLILLLPIHLIRVYLLFLHLVEKYLILIQLDFYQSNFTLFFTQLMYSHLWILLISYLGILITSISFRILVVNGKSRD